MRSRIPDIPGLSQYPDLLKAYEREYAIKLGKPGCGSCQAGPVVQKYRDLMMRRKAEAARYSLANTRKIK